MRGLQDTRRNQRKANRRLSATDVLGRRKSPFSYPSMYTLTVPQPASYRGRFAPSPTGLLHFGSLVTALGSYLDAKAHGGIWLVRMEDIDPPREQAGAASTILKTLEAHGLIADEPVLFQSTRHKAYREALADLGQKGLLYRCQCNRATLSAMGGVYDGRCREVDVAVTSRHALRIKLYREHGDPNNLECFEDLIQGPQQQCLASQAGDQILWRKDGLFAYQLAVVVDDMYQGITHILRGMDLLTVSARQRALFRAFNATPPLFGHLPLAKNTVGQKLSKQNLAPPLDDQQATNNLWQALHFLGQNPPADLLAGHVEEILAWGTTHWQRAAIPRDD